MSFSCLLCLWVARGGSDARTEHGLWCSGLPGFLFSLHTDFRCPLGKLLQPSAPLFLEVMSKREDTHFVVLFEGDLSVPIMWSACTRRGRLPSLGAMWLPQSRPAASPVPVCAEGPWPCACAEPSRSQSCACAEPSRSQSCACAEGPRLSTAGDPLQVNPLPLLPRIPAH